jgi:hypothetical protein
MINNHWLSKSHHDSQPLAQHSTPQWFLIMVSYDEPWDVNDGLVLCVKSCESWRGIPSQWL